MSAGASPLKLGGIATPSPHVGGGAFVFKVLEWRIRGSRKDRKGGKERKEEFLLGVLCFFAPLRELFYKEEIPQ
jgi:hypothetical protein